MPETIDTLAKEIKGLRREITNANRRKKKETWVKPSALKVITGWAGREKLRWARINNLVTFERGKGYLLESIDPIFLISTQETINNATTPQPQ